MKALHGRVLVDGLIDCHGVTDRGDGQGAGDNRFLIAGLTRSLNATHGGLWRSHRGRFSSGTRAGLLAVADGIGAEGAGSLASAAALSAVVGELPDVFPSLSNRDSDHEALRRELLAVLQACQARVEKVAAHRTPHTWLATSLTMVLLHMPLAYVVHAGDSRCYLLRRYALRRVTKDQTFAQRLADHGMLTSKEAALSSWQSVLWSAVGSGPGLTPDVYGLALQAGDVLLLCSAGLAHEIPDRVIGLTLRAATSARQACDWLVALAREGSNTARLTALAARIG
jgi:protein phosphatase